MIIIELTYIKPLNTVEQHLMEHRNFLDKHYDEGIFLCSGPKVPREGGLILAKTTKTDAELLIREDPFYINHVADYRITEFNPNRCNAEHEDIFFANS